jgi:putative pyruvate formate lyase activating enzyme
MASEDGGDALDALKDYFAILTRKKPARHWWARHIPAGLPELGVEEERLWEAHARAMRELSSAWKRGVIPPVGRGPSLLDLKVELSRRLLENCRMCERRCGVNRWEGERGYCGVGPVSRVASEFLHLGEESELVPSHTIFFSGCTFRCVYCQNWDIAMDPRTGNPADPHLLASAIYRGRRQGSRNVNFVGGNPDPHLHAILSTIALLGEEAKYLPMVWNSNMFTSSEAMALLDGVMDIYLGDFRYGNDQCARKYSDVANYTAVVTRNFLQAFRAGEIMLRQLLLPGHLECCTKPIMRWVAENIPGVYFNLMFQYRPEYRAPLYPELNRRPSPEEREEAVTYARSLGLELWD